MEKKKLKTYIEAIKHKAITLRKEFHSTGEFDPMQDPNEPVVFTGNLNAKVVIIGRDLGKNEVLDGEVFCGKCGNMVRDTMTSLDYYLDKGDYCMMNIVPYKPEGNVCFSLKIQKPFFNLTKHLLKIIKPEKIITLGKDSTEAILGFDKVSFLGFVRRTPGGVKHKIFGNSDKEYLVIPAVHPGYIDRNGGINGSIARNLFVKPIERGLKGVEELESIKNVSKTSKSKKSGPFLLPSYEEVKRVQHQKELEAKILKRCKIKNVLKESYLASISKPDGKFKRQNTSPIRYAGGKTQAVGLITEYLPGDVKKVVSPFLGGGSIEIAWAKFLGIDVLGYDAFPPLVGFWKHLLSQPEEFSEMLSKHVPEEEHFNEVKLELKSLWEDALRTNNFEAFDTLKGAVHFYYNHQYCYGPRFLGAVSRPRMTEKFHNTQIKKIKNFRCPNLKVELQDFHDTLENHKDDFLYADPPYLMGKSTKITTQLYELHKGFDHEGLRDLLHEHKGGFILSYNNCDEVKNWYSDYYQCYPKWNYTWHYRKNRGQEFIKNETPEILIIGLP